MNRLQKNLGFSILSLFVGWQIWVILNISTKPIAENQPEIWPEIPEKAQEKSIEADNAPEPVYFYIDTLLKGRFKHPYDLAVDTLNDLLKMYAGKDTAFVEMGPWLWSKKESEHNYLVFLKGGLFQRNQIHTIQVAEVFDSLYLEVVRHDSLSSKSLLKYSGSFFEPMFSTITFNNVDLNGDGFNDIFLTLGNASGSRWLLIQYVFVYLPEQDSFQLAYKGYGNLMFDVKRKIVFNDCDGGCCYHTTELYHWSENQKLVPMKQFVHDSYNDRKNRIYSLDWHDGKDWRQSAKLINPTAREIRRLMLRFDSIAGNDTSGFMNDDYLESLIYFPF